MSATRIVSVAHTGITVSDIERTSQFFREALGAEPTPPVLYTDPVFERITGVDGANIKIAYVNLPGHQLELLEYVRPGKRAQSSLRPCDAGHLHLSLMVEGIDGLAERLRNNGFIPVGPVQEVAADGLKGIYTYGFDGLVIELMEMIPKASVQPS